MINKKIRLVELFAGIGSQAMALRDLCIANGIDSEEVFESYKVIEFDKYPVKSYNAIHGTNIVPTDITEIHGDDLDVKEPDKYVSIWTYSFPCQDLSVAGRGAGMDKGSGTRSGLLWEVERLLNEVDNLPDVLVMENVTQVHGKKNLNNFNQWCKFLESKGYHNHWEDLNAKNYCIPQNRARTFMVSTLQDINYEFPHQVELRLVMKDRLDEKVPQKYYIETEKADQLIQQLVDNGKLDELKKKIILETENDAKNI